MPLSIATWNINSVRLRIDIVRQFLDTAAPDVLCLQETKCPDSEFPRSAFAKSGYDHILHRGMKGYNGVAIISRHPLRALEPLSFCARDDARHIAAVIDHGRGEPVAVHNLYVPAGGDIPDREENPKFGHKLDFLTELTSWAAQNRDINRRAVLVGDLNIAPFETDVWSHKALVKVVSHTPVECDMLNRLRETGGWTDAIRHLTPEPERIYTWWSYRSPDWASADKGRRLDHVWIGSDLVPALERWHVLREARGWTQPSDHVPLMVTLEI